MRFSILPILFLAPAALTLGQAPLNPPVPFAPPAGADPADSALTLEAAERAQALGFPSVAAGLYRQLLALPGADSPGLSLSLATALLDDGRPDEALRALAAAAGPRGSAWHLREGLADAGLRKFDAAKAEEAAVNPTELGSGDWPWYLFLRGMLAGAAADPVRARNFYEQAEGSAPNELARARFLLAQEQERLRVGDVNEAMAAQTLQNAEQFAGTTTGFDFEREYAVMLDALGRRVDAGNALQQDLAGLPAGQRAYADDFHLLLGMIAGAGDGRGRNALIQLLETGSDPDRQRVALGILAQALGAEPGRSFFRAELDKLIAETPPHPILDDLLLRRADLALGDKDYAKAEESASALLNRFPGSQLKPYALGVITSLNWEERRYTTAADYAQKTRDALPPGPERAGLRLVAAEAWFREGDFRNAADAYAAVMRDPPAGVPVGALMFQRVQAQIDAAEQDAAAGRVDALKDAQATLDDLERDTAFDPVDRWEAEWNLSRALERCGQTAAAFGRVNRLLGSGGGPRPGSGGLAEELRARMEWLQARLSFDAGEPKLTLGLVNALLASVARLPESLKTNLASSDSLLKAQACFRLGGDDEALGVLKALRRDYPGTEAAVASYFVEADHDAQQDRVVEAQQLLTRLADDNPTNTYAPYALYQAAGDAERLGADKNLEEADRLIERLVTHYPDSPLYFEARMKEGGILRELNDFSKAQQIYESLIDRFPADPRSILARLELAKCYNAESASDPSHEETARTLFADLRDRVDASVDVRVEAGYNLGKIYERRAEPDRAEQTWLGEVVTPFLLDPAAAKRLEVQGRFFMAKTLLDLGDLFERENRLDEAGNAWRRLLAAGLPGRDLAQQDLERLRPGGGQ